MTKHAAVLIAAVALSLPGMALAAAPKKPATFSGGGGGSPVVFHLNEHGKATSASFAFTCKNVDGIATANTDKKHKPTGKVSHGKITITFTSKRAGKIGPVKATIHATFTSKTRAKGTTSVEGGNCKS